MADKKTIGSVLASNAVARVKEQGSFAGAWGVDEHLACLRYMVVDAIKQAPGMLEKSIASAKSPEEKAQLAKLTLADQVNIELRKAFSSDPELAYASNFQKLLIKAGELKSSGGYE